MFDQRLTGQRIAWHRKEMDLTQADIAEKLGISFQAVSSWERGETMPDLAKLPELAEIFGVPIDVLLGSTPLESEEIKKARETAKKEAETMVDFNASRDTATNTQPEDVTRSVDKGSVEQAVRNAIEGNHQGIDLTQIIQDAVRNALAAAGEQRHINTSGIPATPKTPEIPKMPAIPKMPVMPKIPDMPTFKVHKTSKKGGRETSELLEILPFVSREAASAIVKKEIESGRPISDILPEALPFISRQSAEALIMEALEKGLLPVDSDMDEILPFVGRSCADELAKRALQNGASAESMLEYIVHVSKSTADELAMIAIGKGLITADFPLDEILPHLSKEGADALLTEAVKNGTPLEKLMEALPFISKDRAGGIVEAAIERGISFQGFDMEEILPFVRREYADKLIETAIASGMPYEKLMEALPFVSRAMADKIVLSRYGL